LSNNCCWQAGCIAKKEVWNAVNTPNIKENRFAWQSPSKEEDHYTFRQFRESTG